jgi:hypothetical protein
MKRLLLLITLLAAFSCQDRKQEILTRQQQLNQDMAYLIDYKISHGRLMMQHSSDTVQLYRFRDSIDAAKKNVQMEFDSLEREMDKYK